MKTSLFNNLATKRNQLLLRLISVNIMSSALAYPIVKIILESDSLADRLRISLFVLAASLFFTISIGLINHRLTMRIDDQIFYISVVFILMGTSAVLLGLGIFLLFYSLILH